MLEKAARIRHLIKKYSKGTLTPLETGELNAFLEEDSSHQVLFETLTTDEGIERKLKAFMQAKKMQATVKLPFELDKAAPVVSLTAQHTNRRRRLPYYIAAAMMAFFIVTASIYFLLPIASPDKNVVDIHQQQPDLPPGTRRATLLLADQSSISLDDAQAGEIAWQGNTAITKTAEGALQYNKSGGNINAGTNVLVTPRGGYYMLTLSDGSKIWINADSRLTYPVTFTGTERRVQLIGEAYFEVAKDAHKPFRVSVNDQMEVEVLGTHFDIKAYPEIPTINTTLLEGSVRVGPVPVAGTRSQLLSPGQQAQYSGSTSLLKVLNNTDTDQATAWMHGRFVFTSASLPEVLRELERWYDVTFNYAPGFVDNGDKYSGGFKNTIMLSELLTQLEQLSGLSFRIEKEHVIVSKAIK